MSHPAESTHWYDRQGKPAYTVKAKDGSERPTTLRDARKLNLVPSVTAIIRGAATPGLEVWKRKQVLMSALTLPKIVGEPEDAYLQRILTDSEEQAKKASERGTAIHACLQAFYQHEPWGGYAEHVVGANNAINEWLGITSWEAEKSFSHYYGFGGKVDIFCQAAVCDFKTKEFAPDDELKTWPEHAMQLAAYRVGLKMDQARCAIVYVSVTHPGTSQVIEIPEPELQQGWEMFKALLAYYKAKNRFECAFELETA